MVWNELTKIALLGTENCIISDDTLRTLKEQGFNVEKDQALLLAEAAAFYSQMRKAGFRLEDFTGELPQPAAWENEKTCSFRSAHHLHLILNGKFEPVLPEFIEHLLANKKCLPTEHLPALLSKPDAPALLKTLEPVLGAGGRWLLAQHPEWKNRLADASRFDWHTGSKTERIALLRYLREHDPTNAIELLQSTWQQEDYRDKAAFLNELETGLSAADEPLLEPALDDGRKEVRQAAARLLAKLPGSRFSERLYRRALGCFVFKNNSLQLHLPEEPDEAALRDGILKIDPAWKGGAKAGYLGQVVSAVPPKRWEAFFQKTPVDVLELFFKTDWATTLLPACAEAATLHGDTVWMDALLTWGMGHEASQLWNTEAANRLVEVASSQTMNRLALQYFDRHSGLPEESSPVFKLLKNNAGLWEDRLTLAIVSRFQQWLAKNDRMGWQSFHYKEFLRMAALRSNPNLFEELQKGWNNTSPFWATWEKPVEEMLNTLFFRKEMAEWLNG